MADNVSPADIARYRASPLVFAQDLTIAGGSGPIRFGDVMAPFQSEAFAAMAPSLLAVAAGTKPPIAGFWCERTKGSSKDSDLAVCIVWLLVFAGRPVLIQVGAADQDQAGEVVKAVRELLRHNGWLAALVEVQRFRILNKRTDATCEVLAADGASAHGSRPDLTVCNELSHMREQSFGETMLDNSAKMPNGMVVIATNAGFSGTWQARWREQAMRSERWWFQKVDHPAPWIDQAAVEEARIRNSASRFARLWQGVWSTDGGDALDSGDIEAAVVLDGPERVADPQSWYIGGLDLSIRRDRIGFAVVGVRPGSGKVRLACAKTWQPGSNPEENAADVEREVLTAHARFGLTVLRYDPFAADLVAFRLRRAGLKVLPVPFSGSALDQMAKSLLQAFRERIMELYRDEQLLRDLRALSIEEAHAGWGYKLTAGRTAEGHADLGIALSIALPPAVDLATRGRLGALPPAKKKQVVISTPGNTVPRFANGEVNWPHVAEIKRAREA